MMGGMMLWLLLWGVLGIAVLVLAVVGGAWLVRNLSGRNSPQRTEAESAEEILQRRYAAGEIDEDEFFRRQSGLS